MAIYQGCNPHHLSNRHHLSCDDCLGDKSEDYQNCSVLYCVPQLYTVISTHIGAVLTGVLVTRGCWFNFCKRF